MRLQRHQSETPWSDLRGSRPLRGAGVGAPSAGAPRPKKRGRTKSRAPVEGKRRAPASAREWAQEEFGALTGHAARRACWVELASLACMKPAGTVTATFERDAERQAAYGQLSNPETSAEWLGRAAHEATAHRCEEMAFVWVPLDGSSLQITDKNASKGVGHVGTRASHARGLIVMNAIAISPDGTPMGMVGQQWWTRTGGRTKHKRNRPVEQKETQRWIDGMLYVQDLFREHAPNCKPRFNDDRGADAGAVIAEMVVQKMTGTVRAAHNRRVRRDKRNGYLWSVMRRQPVRACYDLPVPAGPHRTARTARMQLRCAKITIDLRDRRTSKHKPLTINVVYVVEVGTTPRGEKRIEWMLYTTLPIDTVEDALIVAHGYRHRWSIEEFHRTWKSGLCNVEDTQLRDVERIQKWATLLASIAVRAQRLKSLARERPDEPAAEHFSTDEIDAVVLLRQPAGIRSTSAKFTLGQLVRWIADLGGYTGKSSGGPPGQVVISRGLEKVEIAAQALRAQHEMKS